MLTTIGIVAILAGESLVFFEHVPLSDFLLGTEWTPLFDNPKYGILPLLSGTVETSFIALAVAVPMGSIIAIYLSEFAGFGAREVAKPFLELLAGIPTVVYGYFAASRPSDWRLLVERANRRRSDGRAACEP